MKRRSIIFLGLILLVILSLFLTILAKEQTYDFRETTWGMSKEQVKAAEDRKADYEENAMLFYKVKIFGGICSISG